MTTIPNLFSSPEAQAAAAREADWRRLYLLAVETVCVDSRELGKVGRKMADPWKAACELTDQWQAAADKHLAAKAAAASATA